MNELFTYKPPRKSMKTCLCFEYSEKNAQWQGWRKVTGAHCSRLKKSVYFWITDGNAPQTLKLRSRNATTINKSLSRVKSFFTIFILCPFVTF